tara:strand:- start:643 stop:1449 length:807 start_codon:yes stop_codon:yes gene_type:complete
MKIAFIGGGTMAQAIISVLTCSSKKYEIIVSEPIETVRNKIKKKFELVAINDNLLAIENSDIIILCIKPQNFKIVANEIRRKITNIQTIVSIMAGTNINTISNSLSTMNIIRVMPNTPAQIGKGISAWHSTLTVSEKSKLAVKEILSMLGEEIQFQEEKYIDMATAISGSGPAYVFLFIEFLEKVGVEIGLPNDKIRQLILQTISGSVELLSNSDKSPEELRKLVTSPGGTTEAGINSMIMNNFHKSIVTGVKKAYERGKELSNEEKI